MKRFKSPKKNAGPTAKVPTHFIMEVIMPCVMLGCKDKFKIKDQKELDDLGKIIERYISYIADGSVTVEQLHELMEVHNAE